MWRIRLGRGESKGFPSEDASPEGKGHYPRKTGRVGGVDGGVG